MEHKSDELKNNQKPDFIFEVSWEICNKIGGIYTVISTKYEALAASLEDSGQLIMVGPDVWKETTKHPDFEEDLQLMKSWREYAATQGLFFRIGRWNIKGNPLTILVDFTSFFPKKDEIFTKFWETYGLDSISGQWDYIEPAMFGYAAGRVIESFYRGNLSNRARVIAQFHEWLTGTGVLYLKEKTPGIVTAFTTHATVLGRAVAGNGKKLYSTMDKINPDLLAAEFRVKSKYSVEKLAADNADLFTTVSDITAEECRKLIGKNPDIITPNAFNSSFVPKDEKRDEARINARKRIFDVFEALWDTSFNDETLLILTSGRYEFRNKGLDLFIDAVAALASKTGKNRKVVAVIAVPANNQGPRQDLMKKRKGEDTEISDTHNALTHYILHPEHDPVLNRINHNRITNNPDSEVFISFIPVYLNGSDGIFDLDYYNFLCGFDLSVFPSYYEPWGYTPLESAAFRIPTMTTSLAGFGLWVRDVLGHSGNAVAVIERNDFNDADVVNAIERFISFFLTLGHEDHLAITNEAQDIATKANWQDFILNYIQGYNSCFEDALSRAIQDPYDLTNGHKKLLKPQKEHPQWSKLLVKASYPEKLEPLRQLAGNLWWSWNIEATELFESINAELWETSLNNPIKLLSLLSFDELKSLTKDEDFLSRLGSVYKNFTDYLNKQHEEGLPLVAYFSMEYGLHESLKTYSGGLGILAGDYLKEASDDNKQIVGVGLLYRYGYFTQNITPYGDQVAGYYPQKFSDLPIYPVRNENDEWEMITIAFPGRNLFAKVWQVHIGRIKLFLLDTDIEENIPIDRFITHQLYGGDLENRFKQEMLLGVGGIRLLQKLRIEPDVYHCNEGHAAFIGFERIRDLVQREYLSFEEALEVVRASTLFTTHTPVPAGHDRFPEEILRAYISHYPERMHISWDELMSLGREMPDQPGSQFSMSVLAIKTAQEVNGVSKLHGEVSRKMFRHMYDGYFADELHIGYVTNGVHYKTWTNPIWQKIHQNFFESPESDDQYNPLKWQQGIEGVSDETIWNTRNSLKNELLSQLRTRLLQDMTLRQDSPAHIVKVLESLNQPILTIGFARRFATYKRAHLLFTNEERLRKLLSNRKRPMRFIFAGKAHPNDKAGQDLIKRIIGFSHKPEFAGKIIFIENYDMKLGRLLTQGCDVWLNTPMRPMEASGTSGEKAVMNGVLNLSVLDGWWAEGYKPEAGWALSQDRIYQNQDLQDQLDAETIYNIFEEQILPLYYNRNENDIPEGWVMYIRNNFGEITPHFTMKRMLHDYHNLYYKKLAQRNSELRSENFKNAKLLAEWKRRVLIHWGNITLIEKKTHDSTVSPLNLGENFSASIIIHAPGLYPDDLGLELVYGEKVNDVIESIYTAEQLECSSDGNGKLRFECNVPASRSGVFDYAFRLYAKHPLLEYRMDFPLVKWI